jgi:hypothetical protein
LFEGFLFFIVPDSGKQFGYRDDRYVEVRLQPLQVLLGLREYLPDRKLEARHDVSAGQDVGLGEGNDVGW